MHYQEEALKLIAQPENLESAVEIAELLELLKPRFQALFWEELIAKMGQLLADRPELAAGWMVMDASRLYHADYYCVELRPKVILPGKRALRVAIYQGAKKEKYPLHYGVTWVTQFLEWQTASIPGASELCKALEASELQSTPYWIGYRMDLPIASLNFLRCMGTQREAFIGGLAETLLDLLSDFHEQMEAIQTYFSQTGE